MVEITIDVSTIQKSWESRYPPFEIPQPVRDRYRAMCYAEVAAEISQRGWAPGLSWVVRYEEDESPAGIQGRVTASPHINGQPVAWKQLWEREKEALDDPVA